MSCLIVIMKKWIIRPNVKNWKKNQFFELSKIIIIIIILPGNSLNTLYTRTDLTLTTFVSGIICYYQFHFTVLEIGLELRISSIDHALKRAEYPKYKRPQGSKVNWVSHSFLQPDFWGNFLHIPQFTQILAKGFFIALMGTWSKLLQILLSEQSP